MATTHPTLDADAARHHRRPRTRRSERVPVPTTTIGAKAGAAVLAGALVTALLAILAQFAAFDPEPPVVSSLTTLVTFALMWLVPDEYWSRAQSVSGGGASDSTDSRG